MSNKFNISIRDYTHRKTMKSYYLFEKQICNESASLVFVQGIKCAIFENLSTTTNISPYLSGFLAS